MPIDAYPDLRPLYDDTLAPRLAALEEERLKLKHAIFASTLLIGLPVFMAFCGGDSLVALALPDSAQAWITPISFLLIAVGIGIALKKYALPGLSAYMNYRSRFKRDIVAEIFKKVSPGADYQPFSFITPELFDQSGLFQKIGEVRGDDLVRGRIGDTPFEACEMDRHYSTGGKNSRTVSVFHGLFFHFDFNKTIQARTIVQPQKPTGISLGSRGDVSKVTLESPEFEAYFDVYSTSEVEARYILTPALMERILAIHQETKRPICLAFMANRAFVAIDYGRALFEPSIKETTSFESLAEMADHFRLAEVVVRELDLNTRIWTKDVDASLLAAAPAVNKVAALATGDLTPETVMKKMAGDMFVDADAGPPPARPANTRARVEQDGDVTVVRYRLAWWALMCMAISLPCLAVTLAGLSMMVAPAWTLAQLFPVLGVPPEAVDVFRTGALVVTGVSAAIGGFIALYWITYVRRVAIEPDEIRVRRGVNPFSRRYPRSDETRILQMDRYLYLGRAGAFKVLNPSLSPMLRNAEEARWVASEMRQAIARDPRSAS